MHFNLTDLVADITQNSAESGAALVELEIQETAEMPAETPAEFRFIVKDNGKGMSKDILDRAMDPFVSDGVKHPGRKVGLGIPFLIQTAIESGGGWKISSTTAPHPEGETTRRSGGKAASSAEGFSEEPAKGTTVEAWFDLANMDTPPMGDIPGLFRTVLLFAGPEEIVLKRSRKAAAGRENLDYQVKKTELKEALGGDLEDLSSLVLLGKYLRSLEGDETE